MAELLHCLAQGRLGVDGVYVHVLRDGGLHRRREHPGDEGLGALGVGGAGQHPSVLDLARGGRQEGGGAFVFSSVGFCKVNHLAVSILTLSSSAISPVVKPCCLSS